MCMPVYQYVTGPQCRQVIRPKEMTVSQKQSLIFQQHLLPGRGDWKLQQHLIHLAITISPHRDNLRRLFIESLSDLSGRVAFG